MLFCIAFNTVSPNYIIINNLPRLLSQWQGQTD